MEYGYFTRDLVSGDVLRQQKGVFRTNCLDCLDRTNVFQTKIAIQILNIILLSQNINVEEKFKDKILSMADDRKLGQTFFDKFRGIWADNGDLISIHYSGTKSNTSANIRSGGNIWSFLKAGVNSIDKFYQTKLKDQAKTETINMLLGQHYQQVNGNCLLLML